jgi:hypothetical protein
VRETAPPTYKLDVLSVPREVDRQLAMVHDRHQRAILLNFRRHVLLELVGRWPEILTPELTVPHPVYRVVAGQQTTVYDGIDEVAGFYRGLAEAGMTVFSPIEERIAVADWGLVTESRYAQIFLGHALLARGQQVDDADAYYLAALWVANIWRYDKNAKLIGENVYADVSSMQILTKLDPADLVTPQRAAELVAPLLDSPA